MSLRLRLVALTLLLVAGGLAIADVATYRFLDSFLLRRVDSQLRDARGPAAATIERVLFGGAPSGPGGPNRPGGGPPGRFGPPPALTSGSYVELRAPSGRRIGSSLRFGGDAARAGVPKLPATLPAGAFTVGSSTGGPGFRVLATPSPERLGATLVVAVSLRDVESTLHRVLVIELLVTAAVLGAIGLLAFWLIGVGLRPLRRIEATAGAIAAGDLTRRVEPADSRTEVGRLGLALNTMLGRIESAFAERRASEERLRRFVANASHELRTPLASVRGYAELFRRGAADRPEDLALAMRRIESEAERMGVLVDDLLLLARLDEGRPLAREPVDLARLAADAVADGRAADPERPLHLETSGPAVIVGDELRLRQVLANLLSNARVHTPPGTPVLVSVAAAGDAATVSVADEGPGLSPEDAQRVFERFFRADPSRARASGGTGLGLAIVEGIVAAHGGRVSLESEPGRGATFRVTLPRGGGEAHPSPQAASADYPAA